MNPLRDIAAMDAELLLNDLIAVERKQERLAEERKKGGGRDNALKSNARLPFSKNWLPHWLEKSHSAC